MKSRYDYVLLDTAPIGMVTETAIISRVADMCVYVCRADVTLKAAFCYINVLRDEHKFDKLAVVVNGIDLSKRKTPMVTVMVRNMVMAMVNIMVMDTAMGMVLRQRIRKENNWI